MEKTNICNEIESLLNQLNQRFSGFNKNEKINEGELRDFISRIYELNNKAAVLQYLNSKQEETKVVEKAPVEPVVKQVAAEIKVPEPAALIIEEPPVVEEQKAIVSPTPPVQVEKKGVFSIQKSIGIADKFEFINELFKGNATKYDEAITQINSSPDSKQALQTFSELKKQYGWSEENESANKLLEIIKNRLS